jgi:hypothetical protein
MADCLAWRRVAIPGQLDCPWLQQWQVAVRHSLAALLRLQIEMLRED